VARKLSGSKSRFLFGLVVAGAIVVGGAIMTSPKV
jgi:hypothetical protein